MIQNIRVQFFFCSVLNLARTSATIKQRLGSLQNQRCGLVALQNAGSPEEDKMSRHFDFAKHCSGGENKD